MGQMSIFDYLPRPFDPVHFVAMTASVYWEDSKTRLISYCNTDPDIETWSEVVRHEYCPYGGSGFYGGSGEPNTVRGWDMRSDNISIEFFDAAGVKQKKLIGWEEFAREVADIIWGNDVLQWRDK